MGKQKGIHLKEALAPSGINKLPFSDWELAAAAADSKNGHETIWQSRKVVVR